MERSLKKPEIEAKLCFSPETSSNSQPTLSLANEEDAVNPLAIDTTVISKPQMGTLRHGATK